MNINFRVLSILGFTVIFLILALNIIAQMVILSSSFQADVQQSDANVQFIRDRIQHEGDLLGTKARDWAVWDDTYEFMNDRNPAYSKTVIAPDITYQSLQITGLLLFDTNGTIVASQRFDPDRDTVSALSDSTVTYFSKNLNLLSATRGGRKRSGIVSLPDGLFLVGMHTILPTAGGGPGRGTMVMLQPFDETKITAIGTQLRLGVTIYRLSDPGVRNNPIVLRLSGAGAPPVESRARDSEIISGYTLIPDINNEPVLLLEVSSPRTVSQQASYSVWTLIAAVLIAGIIYIIVTLIVLNRFVISPLSTLDKTLKKIPGTGDRSERLAVDGDDEIASLKQTLNVLLGDLQVQKSALTEAVRKSEMQPDLIFNMLARDIRASLNSQKARTDNPSPVTEMPDAEYAKPIADGLSPIEQVIRNLETASRLYRSQPALEPLFLEDLLKNESRDNPGEKLRWQDDCAVSVLADEMLGTAFHTILVERLTTTGPGTEITVSARDNMDGSVEISFIDNSKGIPDEMKSRIFDGVPMDPDQNVQNATGLYMAKLILRSYGGRVWVDDRVPGQPERGLVIRLTLKKA